MSFELKGFVELEGDDEYLLRVVLKRTLSAWLRLMFQSTRAMSFQLGIFTE